MVARLTRLLGPRHFGLAEDAVQDAICAALETWKFRGVPEQPEAWLMRAARNRAIDLIRADQRSLDILGRIAVDPTTGGAETPDADMENGGRHDDRLALMFSCCHPKLATEAQLALILKALCGFSLDEIAAAFFASRPAVEKRVTRAKSYLRRSRVLFDLDNPSHVIVRLGTVHHALYLLFREGYHSLKADAPVRDELCHEAIRLALLLAKDTVTHLPATDALLALMYFNLARLGARVDEEGVFLSLPRQDRTRWDRWLIALGFQYLEASATGVELSRFHLEAAIAAEHCQATRFADTNWRRILEFYNMLALTTPSPIVALNRAIAWGQVEGPAAGLEAVGRLANEPFVRTYPFFHAAVGELSLALGKRAAAIDAFKQAFAVARSPGERVFYDRRLQELTSLEGALSATSPSRLLLNADN
jgi:RNA polymerase sigma factor (sigma-70 family)